MFEVSTDLKLITLAKFKTKWFIHSTSTTATTSITLQAVRHLLLYCCPSLCTFLSFYKEEEHMVLAKILSVLIKCSLWKEHLNNNTKYQQNEQWDRHKNMTSSCLVQLTNSNIVGDSRLSTYTIIGNFTNHWLL